MKKKWMILLSLLAGIVFIAAVATNIGIIKPVPVKVEDATADKESNGKLSIAIVNEDTGTNYNGQVIQLGNLFGDKLAKDSHYQASLVSRSVAARGIEEDQFDLMVLIPNDFSDKSFGLELESPTPASIQYQVNTQNVIEVQQIAETTANQIIQDLNQELITIYFSSILGNLNEAQTNVSQVVEREGDALGYYNETLMNPLNQFSNQFSNLSSVAGQSESGLTELDRNMETTNNRFGSIVGQDRTYEEQMQAIIAEQTAFADNVQKQQESMTSFEEQMAQLSVAEQIAVLELTNDMISSQFVANPIYNETQQDSQAINQYLHALTENLSSRNADINTYLDEEFTPNVYRVLAEQLRNEKNQSISLESINAPVHQAVNESLLEKIDELPSMNKQEINASELSQTQKDTFNRVIDFSEAYLEKQPSLPPMTIKPGLGLDEPLIKVNQDLRQTGKTVTIHTEVDLADAAKFIVELPNKYAIIEANVFYGDSKEILDVNGNTAASKALTVENKDSNQSVRLELTFRLNDNAAVVAEESVETTFTIEKQASKTIEGEKKSIMDRIKELFGLKETSETVVQFFIPTVHATEVEPEENEQPTETETKPELDDIEIPDETDTDDSIVEEEEIPDSEPDMDGDGQSDTVDTDIDGDGYSNESEIKAGSDPRNPKSIPAAVIEEPMGEPFVITQDDKIVIRSTTELVPDRKTLQEQVFSEAVAPYHELSTLIDLYYGYNLENGESVPANLVGKDGSLYGLLNTDDLADSITQSLVSSLVRDVSQITETTDAVIEDIGSLQVNTEDLALQMNSIQSSNQTLYQTIAGTLNEVVVMHETLTQRTPFEPVILEDTEGMVTVATGMNEDLSELLGASQELMEQTGANKEAAKDVYGIFDELNNRVAVIEDQGTILRDSSDQFISELMYTYNENNSFAENFSQVMANSQIGNRKNESLYDYLAQPISTMDQSVTSNDLTEEETQVESALHTDNRSSFIIIILAYLISLLTAHMFNQFGDIRFGERAFAKETRVSKNVPVTILATGAAIVEGIVMGLIMANQLALSTSRTLGFVVLMSVILVALVAANTWLLRQLSSIGMFLSLGIFTLYLISANQLLLGSYQKVNEQISSWNPLGYLEEMVYAFINGFGSWASAVGVTLVVGLIFIMLNLFVKKWLPSMAPRTSGQE